MPNLVTVSQTMFAYMGSKQCLWGGGTFMSDARNLTFLLTRISSATKFAPNPSITFRVLLFTDTQTDTRARHVLRFCPQWAIPPPPRRLWITPFLYFCTFYYSIFVCLLFVVYITAATMCYGQYINI